MKNSLDHLPEDKQRELARVVEVIRAASDDVEMVILFGSYARGVYKVEADLEPDRWSGHASDYDILVATGEKSTAEDVGLSHRITRQCETLSLSTHVRPIVHDIEHLNIQLAEGHYFYSDIKKDGCWLYDSGKFELSSQRELEPLEKRRIAQDHYDHWFSRAEDFWFGFEKYFEAERWKIAAFNLHQATEAAYKTVLLVFTNYSPDEHFLHKLCYMALKYHAELAEIIPRKTEEEDKRFELLDLAYIGARYQPGYRITKEDLEYLGPCVRRLLDVTETICRSKLESFATDDESSGAE